MAKSRTLTCVGYRINNRCRPCTLFSHGLVLIVNVFQKLCKKRILNMLRPHWLDDVIDSVIRENNANAVARAISHSPHFLKAIEKGIADAKHAKPGVPGPTHAQCVRMAVQEAVGSES